MSNAKITPPPVPPNRTIDYSWFTHTETPASKRRMAEYKADLAAWRRQIDDEIERAKGGEG